MTRTVDRRMPRSKMTRSEKRETVKGYLFVSPYLLGFLAFTMIPMAFSLYSSFTFYDITSIQRWVGLNNYIQIFTKDPKFTTALYNTAYYVIFSVPAVIIVALMLALMMNLKIYFARIFRTLYYLPTVLSGVAVFLLWQWIFDASNGLLNNALGLIQINGPAWLQDPNWTKPALIIMRLWSTGGTMVLFLAALQGVPVELYEACTLDGATGWKRFWNITLPMISPTMLFVMITAINGAFQIFDAPYIMGGTTVGGPGQSLLFYNIYLYNAAIKEFRMGYACALAWVLFAIIMSFTAVQMKASNRWVHYEGESKK